MGGSGSRLSKELLAEYQANPFKERICRVFSTSPTRDSLSFEDFLDLLSVFSDTATPDIKSHYAFRIFDFDDDGTLDREDLSRLVNCLTGEGEDTRLSASEMKQLIDNVSSRAGGGRRAQGAGAGGGLPEASPLPDLGGVRHRPGRHHQPVRVPARHLTLTRLCQLLQDCPVTAAPTCPRTRPLWSCGQGVHLWCQGRPCRPSLELAPCRLGLGQGRVLLVRASPLLTAIKCSVSTQQ
uniref:Calcium and integrin-binding protein 1 n=1 Tax=Oryctolagus cuniculus TaxID=9986 RepID=A0A5F9DCS4_RABIT